MGVELIDSREPVEVPTQSTRLVGVLGVQLQLGAERGQLQPLPACRAWAPADSAPDPAGGAWGQSILTRALSSLFHRKVSPSRTVTLR